MNEVVKPVKMPSASALRERLGICDRWRNAGITLDGVRIGGMVQYGRSGSRRGNGFPKTVYASRIYGHGSSIEEEASKPAALLTKVAKALARDIKAGKRPVPEAAAVENVSRSAVGVQEQVSSASLD